MLKNNDKLETFLQGLHTTKRAGAQLFQDLTHHRQTWMRNKCKLIFRLRTCCKLLSCKSVLNAGGLWMLGWHHRGSGEASYLLCITTMETRIWAGVKLQANTSNTLTATKMGAHGLNTLEIWNNNKKNLNDTITI